MRPIYSDRRMLQEACNLSETLYVEMVSPGVLAYLVAKRRGIFGPEVLTDFEMFKES